METTPTRGLPYLTTNDRAKNIPAQSKAIALRLEELMDDGTLRGPKGEPGLPGVNAVPADTAVGTYLGTEGTATRTEATDLVQLVGDARYPRTDDPLNVRMGPQALADAATSAARNNEAIGVGALQSLTKGVYNTAVGLNALYSLNGAGTSGMEATRNTAVGSNTQRFNRTGYNNISMGRNSMQVNVAGNNNVGIGAGAMSGYAPIGLGGVIENQNPVNPDSNVAVGTSTLVHTGGSYNVAVGYEAGSNIKGSVSNTAVGYQALTSLESGVAPNGKQQDTVSLAPAYTFSGTSINHTLSGHGLAVGDMVRVKYGTRESQWLKVTAAAASTFTLSANGNTLPAESGTAQIDLVARNAVTPASSSSNTAVGSLALTNLRGPNAGNNTAVGYGAMRFMQDGSACTYVRNSISIGFNTGVSGDAQMQLGPNTVTVYAGQAIQIRSDARDKRDVRPTVLGLEFIERLRPVDFRWDRRSDYVEYDEDGDVVAVGEPDGSRAGRRFHHGFIAQDVQRVIEETGVDFGGFQDHKVNGGNDVLSLGHEELIAPLVRAVQQLAARVADLEGGKHA